MREVLEKKRGEREARVDKEMAVGLAKVWREWRN